MPYLRGIIPQTKGRLAQSLIIRSYVVDEDYNSFSNPTGFSTGKVVGACMQFDRQEFRKTINRKSIGKKGFRPFHNIPLACDVDITMKRVALYREDFLSEIGNISGSLMYQDRPLVLEEVQRTPLGGSEIFQYHDCWFETNPMNYDIMGDLLIVQNIKVSCLYMESLGRGFSGFPGIARDATDLVSKFIL